MIAIVICAVLLIALLYTANLLTPFKDIKSAVVNAVKSVVSDTKNYKSRQVKRDHPKWLLRK